MPQSSPVVLVHGAWHGPWCWERVLPLLEGHGIETHVIDLPSCDPTAGYITTLHDDAAVLRKTLDALERPAIVLGHSYGGMVITEGAAGHPNARHLVYLTAFMPDAGESLNTLIAQTPNFEVAAALRVDADRRTSLAPELVGPLFYGDCDDATVDWAVSRLRPLLSRSSEPVTAAAWHDIPSTYAVCTADRAIPPDLQRTMAARATSCVEWPTSHSPFASQPALVADLLADLASSASAGTHT